MRFSLRKASNILFEDEIEINTLEELIQYIDNINEDIVIGKDIVEEKNKYRIIIYDYYLE